VADSKDQDAEAGESMLASVIQRGREREAFWTSIKQKVATRLVDLEVEKREQEWEEKEEGDEEEEGRDREKEKEAFLDRSIIEQEVEVDMAALDKEGGPCSSLWGEYLSTASESDMHTQSTSCTPLHTSIQMSRLREVTSLLIQHPHLQVEKADGQGMTPLHYALAMNERQIALDILSYRGASLNKRDAQGHSGWKYALCQLAQNSLEEDISFMENLLSHFVDADAYDH
jgi:hypothetical protein